MKNFFVSLFIFCGVAIVPAIAKEPSSQPIENRFLFVMETSSLANRSAEAAQKAVLDLIESGVQGQMSPGDTFGLWTFNEQLDTTFPMQHWSGTNNQALALGTADYLKKLRYEKKGRLQTVLPALGSVIKPSRALTVILLTTGNEEIRGTPVDKQINSMFTTHARELRDAKHSFVTIMVVRNGKIVTHSVNSSLSPINIPVVPLPEKPAPQIKTNLLAVAPKPSPATNRVASPKAKSIILKGVPRDNPIPATNTPVVVVTTNSAAQTNVAPAPLTVATATEAPKQVEALPSPILTPLLVQAQTTTVAVTTAPTLASPAPPIPGAEPGNAANGVASLLPDSKKSAEVQFDDPSTFKPQAQVVGMAKGAALPVRSNNNTAIQHADPSGPSSNIAASSPTSEQLASLQPVGSPKRAILIGVSLLIVAGLLVFFPPAIFAKEIQPQPDFAFNGSAAEITMEKSDRSGRFGF